MNFQRASLWRRFCQSKMPMICSWMAIVACFLGVGCESKPKAAVDLGGVIGGGGGAASFDRPRGIVCDADGDLLYVLDRSGVVRKLTTTGEFRASWRMPKVEKGSPEDLVINRAGNVMVADTHYSRIVTFTPTGERLAEFGSYGIEDGQFIYPVGICVDDADNVYVADYGDVDRIQKFDKTGRHLATWGGFGKEPGKLQRPAGIYWHQGRLYVADSCNHRVQIFHDDGRLDRVIGSHGDQPGQFRYPYDVEVRDGRILVLEYGSQQVQVFDEDGRSIRAVGEPGRGSGQLFLPWRFTSVANAVYVSDTSNNRVVRLGL